jgi:hypothetical protein
VSSTSGPWQRFEFDQPGEALEIPAIEGEETVNAVRQHCRHQIGIVDLLAGTWIGFQELQQPFKNFLVVIGNCGAAGRLA